MPVTTTFYARQRHELEVAAHSWKPEVGGDVVSVDLYDGAGHLSVTLTPDQWTTVIAEVSRHIDVPQTAPAEVTS